MRPLMQCIALFMAALWLPATQHCTLDALGILEAHVIQHDAHGCTTHHTDEPQHAHDTCVIVESPTWLNTATHLQAPPPQVSPHKTQAISHSLAALISTLSALQPFSSSVLSSAPPHTREHPQNWIPARHFAHREARPARAPDSLQA